ncbi:hypothetical protein MMP66_16180 [Acinetobacter dispersus]|uniref:hypothetical protein n=1 Tax=Acinetobacter TaxID=469 RepID=UPI00148FB2C1|nr:MULTISPECIES: hypothetical protein [Acinetobacter]MCH7395792.1 hypothetical protein [Acinetobacter dispersus]NNP75057.1 hypothetical protein [Acinetobacter sp. Ac_3412]
MIISFADEYKIDLSIFEKTGAFDPILGIDTRLFIDPSLIRNTDIPEFSGTYIKIQEFFEKIIRLLKQAKSNSLNDIFWKKAFNLFESSEIKGSHIGYSSKSTRGSGIGPKKKKRILTDIKSIINAGNEDPTIFELLGAFEEDVGPDLISDMITNILIEQFIFYTQRICRELDVELKLLKFSNNYPAEKLPQNPYNKEPIILIPKVFLRDLPVANDFADLNWIKAYNDELKEFVNQIFRDAYKEVTTQEKKNYIKDVFIKYPDLLKDLLGEYFRSKPSYYNFEEDKAGEISWYRTAQSILLESPLELKLKKEPTLENVYRVVNKICVHFKDLIENNGLCKLLYDDKDKRKRESASQLLFFGIANAYCNANNLDLTLEADAGRGPVDFKISLGASAKVIVEIKLSSNKQLVHGYEKQLPIYKKAEKSQKGIYLVLYNGGITNSRWQSFNELVKNSAMPNIEVVIVNAIPKASASVADE